MFDDLPPSTKVVTNDPRGVVDAFMDQLEAIRPGIDNELDRARMARSLNAKGVVLVFCLLAYGEADSVSEAMRCLKRGDCT